MNSHMKSIFVVFLTVFGTAAMAQYSEDVSEFRPTFVVEDIVIEVKDSVVVEEAIEPEKDITKLVEESMDILAENNAAYDYIPGYRIQIYAGSSEGSAQSIRSIARSYFTAEELPLELNYELPNFKVKAGDFVDKLTAYRWYLKLKEHFPRALLVPEQRVKLSNVH